MARFEVEIDYYSAVATLIKAQKIANRTVKKGLTGGWIVALDYRDEVDANGVTGKVALLVCLGTPPSYEGWEFLGVADFIEGEILNRTYAGVEDGLVRVTENFCQHCNSYRARNSLIVVRSSDGEIKQVGSTCVKDFLGWDFTPVALPVEDEFRALGGSGKGGLHGVDLEIFTAHVVATAKAKGFATRRSGEYSTSLQVWDSFFGTPDQKAGKTTPTEADIAEAVDLIEFGNALEGESDYVYNLKTALSLSLVYLKTAGLIASIYKVKQNSVAKEAEAKIARTFKPELLAEIGTKVEIEVEVLSATDIWGQYGLSVLYVMASGDYRVKWFASSDSLLESGKRFKIKGTVKALDEYQGAFATVLTRCKVLEVATI